MKPTYCIYIDVLGYKEIVFNVSLTLEKKREILENIYSNLAASLGGVVNQINQNIADKIFFKSFSDCFYLESDGLNALFYSCYRIFNNTFGFYKKFSPEEKYTPLIRGGIVKDWTLKFLDIASYANNKLDNSNPVGLGVARAYLTSEKSLLSGMRLIISPEVFGDLNISEIPNATFECYQIQCNTSESEGVQIPLYFSPIRENEKCEKVNLFELLWPDKDSIIVDYQDILHKIKDNFTDKHIRHFKKTCEVIYKALQLNKSLRTQANFEMFRKQLEEYINKG